MKTFNQFLNERYAMNYNNSIVVDIQPVYEKSFYWMTQNFSKHIVNLLTNGKKVLYFFNGSESGISEDNKQSITYWLVENYPYANNENDDYYDEQEKIYNLILNNCHWIDKGYGFFRELMDIGIEENKIIKIIRYLYVNKLRSLKDADPFVIENLIDERLSRNVDFYCPNIEIDLLKRFNGSHIMGGYEHECLKEITLLMNAFNIKYTLLKQFTF